MTSLKYGIFLCPEEWYEKFQTLDDIGTGPM